MAFGLEFINDAGSMCISENYKNPIVVASGSATTVSASPFAATSKFTVTYTRSSLDEAVICAIRPTAMTMLIGVGSPNSLTWTWEFFSTHAIGATVPYWIFSNKAAVPADTFGLEVFDASGARVFSSNSKPLRLRDKVSHTLSAGSTTDRFYNTGRTYAMAMPKWTDYGNYNIMENTTAMFGGGVMGITDGFRAGGCFYNTVSGDNSGNPWNVMDILVVDVTGY